jgi:hypothetical protein
MATLQIVDNGVNTIADTVQEFYTSPAGQATVIESFTASNTSKVNASYTAYIQSPSGVLQAQIPFKVVVWGENDLGIGIVNQVIPPGGSLRIESSAIDSIYFTVTGRQI